MTILAGRRMCSAGLVMVVLASMAAPYRVRADTVPLASASVRRACPEPSTRAPVTCLALVRTDVTPKRGIQPQRAPAGLGAADLRDAYRLPTATGGKGATVAVVNVFDDPKAESDLAVYRAQYGLPPCTTANGCFKKINASGGSTLPRADTGWGEEMSLDLDMVSAACPNCHILLVEADQTSISSLGVGVDTAVRLGAKYVSNSYGGPEAAVAGAADLGHYDHPGVAITAASGDGGYGVLFPATSPRVTAVGGTTLIHAANARGWDETAWSGAGSGCSTAAVKPPWQKDAGCPRRTISDVSAVADPHTGVAVYDTYGFGGWLIVGGTSAAAPLIAGAYALAGSLPSHGYAAASPYAHPNRLNDIVRGSTGTCDPAYLCTAGPGYDGPTGLGTPNGVDAFKAVRPSTLARPSHPPRQDGREAEAGAAGRTGTAPSPAHRGQGALARTKVPAAPARTPSRAAGVVNGGFEGGDLSGWSTSGVTAVTKDHPHSGKYAALLGDPDEPHKGDSTVRQRFTSARNHRRLSFWYAVTCRDTEGEKYDWATASLTDDTTGATRTILPKTCTYNDPWRQVSAPVVGGHAYTLTLVSHDDGYFGDPTATKYDDVTLS